MEWLELLYARCTPTCLHSNVTNLHWSNLLRQMLSTETKNTAGTKDEATCVACGVESEKDLFTKESLGHESRNQIKSIHIKSK